MRFFQQRKITFIVFYKTQSQFKNSYPFTHAWFRSKLSPSSPFSIFPLFKHRIFGRKLILVEALSALNRDLIDLTTLSCWSENLEKSLRADGTIQSFCSSRRVGRISKKDEEISEVWKKEFKNCKMIILTYNLLRLACFQERFQDIICRWMSCHFLETIGNKCLE